MNFDTTVKPGETKAAYTKRITLEMEAATTQQRWELTHHKIPVVMDVDDFGFLLPGYDDLLRLKRSFKDFKITAFTIPLPKEFYDPNNIKHFSVEKFKQWARLVNEQDWLEVAIHGFSHTHHEMETTYEKAIRTLEATENFFAEMGLKYSKIFKAPYWQYSYDSLVALRDKGYVVAIDRNHQRTVPDGLRTYLYNWSFEEPLPLTSVIKGHGHFTGQNVNNIGDTLANILHHLPSESKFLTISEYLENEKNK